MANAWRARLAPILASPERLVPRLLFAATFLAFVMALAAPINQRADLWRGPPDEYGHRAAARYYVKHWLPPRVGEAAAMDSYSRDYGFSYLNDTDPVYFFAGKVAALLSPFVQDDLGFRLFNVLLLGILAALCRRRPATWLVFAPLLLSPQVWYIFSYFNGDGFPLFLTICIAAALVDPQSRFNRYLDDPRLLANLTGPLIVGALVGLLALSKTNYLPLVAFLPAAVALLRLGVGSALVLGAAAIAAAAWQVGWLELGRETVYQAGACVAIVFLCLVFRDRAARRDRAWALAKLAVVATLALGVVGSRYAWDAMNHGSLEEKRLAIGTVQEKLAKPEYKPSLVFVQRSSAAYYGLELRARGTRLAALFQPPWDWHARTFHSATGQYDWLTISSPQAYYWAMAALYLAIASLYCVAVARARSASAAAGLLLVAGFTALTLAGSLYHSWAHDFQAQGRYLFPTLAMLGFGMHLVRERMRNPLTVGAILLCFTLATGSFVLVGLWKVPQVF